MQCLRQLQSGGCASRQDARKTWSQAYNTLPSRAALCVCHCRRLVGRARKNCVDQWEGRRSYLGFEAGTPNICIFYYNAFQVYDGWHAGDWRRLEWI